MKLRGGPSGFKPFTGSFWRITASDVLLGRHHLKMSGIDATSNPTFMIYLKAIWDGAVGLLISQPVSERQFFAHPDRGIPFVKTTHPKETTRVWFWY
jgi:hypothetical protein